MLNKITNKERRKRSKHNEKTLAYLKFLKLPH